MSLCFFSSQEITQILLTIRCRQKNFLGAQSSGAVAAIKFGCSISDGDPTEASVTDLHTHDGGGKTVMLVRFFAC